MLTKSWQLHLEHPFPPRVSCAGGVHREQHERVLRLGACRSAYRTEVIDSSCKFFAILMLFSLSTIYHQHPILYSQQQP